MAKGKYRLNSQHFWAGDMLLEPGTIVGEGTQYPLDGPPSLNMTPLDPEAEEEVAKLSEKARPEAPAPASALGSNPALGPGQKVSGGPPTPKAAQAQASAAAGIPPEEKARMAAADAAAARDAGGGLTKG